MKRHQNRGGKQTEEASREEQSRDLYEDDDPAHGNERDEADEMGKKMIDDGNEEVKHEHQLEQTERREDEVKSSDEQVSQRLGELDLEAQSVVSQQIGKAEQKEKEMVHEEATRTETMIQEDQGDAERLRDTPGQRQQEEEEQHVREVLLKDQGTEALLKSYRKDNFTEKGDNFMCAVLRLTISFTLAGHTHHNTYIVKSNQGIFGCLIDLTQVAYQKECLMYRTLVHAFNTELRMGHQEPLRLPRCFLQNLREGRGVIIMEDLFRKGFKMVRSSSFGLDASHAKLIIQELGRLHASSFLYQASLPSHNLAHEYPLLQKDWHNYSKVATTEMGAILKSNLVVLAAVAEGAGRPKDEVVWLRDLSTRALQVFIQQLATEPQFAVLCHGDCWIKNFLFRYDSEGVPVEIRMLDMQLCRRGSAALDLITFMYTSLTGQERRACLASLLHEYHASFSRVMQARGVPVPFTLDQLVAEYRKKSLFGLLMGSDYLAIVSVEPSDIPNMDLLNSGEEVFIRHRLDKLPGILQRNPHLLTLFLDLLDDMTDLGALEDDQTTRV